MSMDYFGGTTSQAAIAEITFSVGMMAGGIILGLWGGFKKRGKTLCTAIALMGIAIGAAGILPISGFVAFAFLSFFMGLSAPFFNGPFMALMQEKIPPEYLGRVFGLYGSLMSMTMLLGLTASGFSADAVGVSIWFLICGIVISLLALIAILTPSIRNI